MMKQWILRKLRSVGFGIVQYHDVSAEDRAILDAIAPYTMTSTERQLSLISAVRHVVRSGIKGSLVECGVWRGGSSMAMALTCIQERCTDRDIYLFDTFEGMTQPTDVDKLHDGSSAAERMAETPKGKGIWCYAGIEDVQANMASTNYPKDRVKLVKGPVEKTIPAQTPAGPIALLRLDTDWYESTKHEMHHLFPRLQEGGILVIDDYGFHEGARKAIDEYLAAYPKRYFLHRIDNTGRMLVKH